MAQPIAHKDATIEVKEGLSVQVLGGDPIPPDLIELYKEQVGSPDDADSADKKPAAKPAPATK